MAESRTLRVLALLDQGGLHVYRELAAPLLRHLSECRGVAVDLDGRIADHDVLLCAHDRVPDERLAAEITRFVNRGGGVVAVHATLGEWARSPELSALAGWAPGEPAALTELRVHPAEHPVTDRLDREIRIRDELLLSEPPPPDATSLLTVPWHFSRRTVAFSRPRAGGCVVHFGLGHGEAAWSHPAFAQLVHRLLRHAAGVDAAPPIGVGLY